MRPLDVIYYPGTPARGRVKAKPPRWVITERGSYCSLLEITAGVVTNTAPAELYAILDVMVQDFNGLRLRDGTIARETEGIRDAMARLHP